MKARHVLMIGAVVVLIVLTGTGIVGGPLGTLLVIGLLLLCPLMMLNMHGGRRQGARRPPSGSGGREEVRRHGR
jgi:hypothetical protein